MIWLCKLRYLLKISRLFNSPESSSGLTGEWLGDCPNEVGECPASLFFRLLYSCLSLNLGRESGSIVSSPSFDICVPQFLWVALPDSFLTALDFKNTVLRFFVLLGLGRKGKSVSVSEVRFLTWIMGSLRRMIPANSGWETRWFILSYSAALTSSSLPCTRLTAPKLRIPLKLKFTLASPSFSCSLVVFSDGCANRVAKGA